MFIDNYIEEFNITIGNNNKSIDRLIECQAIANDRVVKAGQVKDKMRHLESQFVKKKVEFHEKIEKFIE